MTPNEPRCIVCFTDPPAHMQRVCDTCITSRMACGLCGHPRASFSAICAQCFPELAAALDNAPTVEEWAAKR